MLITQCPNCQSKYRASQSMIDAYDGFFRCGKCDYKFNFHDQFSRQAIVNEPELLAHNSESGRYDSDPQLDSKHSVDSVDRATNLAAEANPLIVKADLPQLELDDANILFNQYDDLEDELGEPKLDASQDQALFTRHDTEELYDKDFLDESLLAGLDDEYELQRKAILGKSNMPDEELGLTDFVEPKIGNVDVLADQYINNEHFEPALSILDDVEEDEPQVISRFAVLRAAITHVTRFFFWLIIILMLLGLLVYQSKSTLSTSLQDRISDSLMMFYLCKFTECESGLNPPSLDIVVSRMDLNPTPSEPLNVSLFILNKLKQAQAYPVIKLSLKNLQGFTVGQRFFQTEDYLTNPSAVIAPGNIGKVILKLDNPPENAVGFEVSLH